MSMELWVVLDLLAYFQFTGNKSVIQNDIFISCVVMR